MLAARVPDRAPRAGGPWRVLAGPRRLTGLRLGLLLLIDHAVVLVMAALAAPLVGSREPFKGSWDQLVLQGTGFVSQLLSSWQRWDALWYQHITEVGYGVGDGSTAFFPLYPILGRLATPVAGGMTFVGLLLISALAYLGVVVSLWRLARLEALRLSRRDRDHGASRRSPSRLVALLTILLTVFFPTGFFLLAPYTESLFLLLSVATLWFIRTDRPWLAGITGLLAGLSRAQGAFLAFPLVYHQSLTARGAGQGRSWASARCWGLSLLPGAMPLAGGLLFGVYQAFVLGEARIGLAGQAPWGYRVVPPWETLIASWDYIVQHAGQPSAAVEALNLVSLVGFTAIALLAVRRLPLEYALYALPSIALLLVRQMWLSPLMSVSRFVLVLFPCTILIAMWLAPRPRLATAWVVASLLVQLALFQYWVRWGFVA